MNVKDALSGSRDYITKASLGMMVLGVFLVVSGNFYIENAFTTKIYLTVIFFTIVMAIVDFHRLGFIQRLVADSTLFKILSSLMLWCLVSSWVVSEDFSKIFLRLLCITVFVMGVAWLRFYHQQLFYRVLYLGVVVATLLLAYSFFDFYADKSFKSRLRGFGLDTRNPVVVGIVSGGLSVLAYALLRASTWSRMASHGLKLCAVILFVVSIFTWSKTVVLGFSAAVIFYLISRGDVKKFFNSFVAMVVVFAFFMWLSDSWRLVNLDSISTLSNRLPIWINSMDTIRSNLLFGSGLDYEGSFIGGRGKPMEHLHNSYLQALFYTGVAGFALFSAMYIYPLASICFGRMKRSRHLVFLFGFAAGVQLVEVHVFLSRPNFYWFLLWLPIGWFIAEELEASERIRGERDK
ncbi:MAG: O-antigen ligase WaaL [Candidatus Pelagadaptatus aseana]|uniref:O-antigen ligase family protein n=1 Tax=Candidatus Pelagadaptatus aseana TaxID=3120508 RepID=UPI0039B15901